MPSGLIEEKFQKLLKTLENNNYSAEDLMIVQEAFILAQKAHQGQKRISGRPYITHPLATAEKLAELGLPLAIVAAGLVHDVPEDTDYSLKDIEKKLGSEIAGLVAGITKLGTLKYRGIERYAENLRKMFVAMSNDIRIILIKFSDRLHNLETLDALPREKQIRIAKESLEIYAPIADRLGMSQIQRELEDLSFKYLKPREYRQLEKILPEKYKIREKQLEKIKKRVAKALTDRKISINKMTIYGRTKHFYSLHQKLQKKEINQDFEKIYDLIALRIITPTVAGCYSILGILHELYKPIPDRIKDYIAQPKPNGYQSLQTTVFTKTAGIMEFQIRTPEMHQKAEFGIAAHWSYKKNNSRPSKQDLKWINELVEWQKKIQSNKQFLQEVKLDIFQNQIFVFTPQGDVISLPEKSTPIDFAYRVHTFLGDRCIGAKVNNQMSRLNTELKNGDIVEIIVDKNRQRPNPDWLEIAKTSMAKSKIRAALNKTKDSG